MTSTLPSELVLPGSLTKALPPHGSFIPERVLCQCIEDLLTALSGIEFQVRNTMCYTLTIKS